MPSLKIVIRAGVVALALLAGACATVPAPPIPLDGLPPAFAMAGRMAVNRDGQGEILRVRWQRSPRGEVMILATPVGTEVARIERAAGGVVVHRPGARPVAAAGFAELTRDILGAAIDDRLLVAWLHGRATAGPEGWRVTIDEMQRVGGSDVARRLAAVRDDVTVKLVVDDYEVLPE